MEINNSQPQMEKPATIADMCYVYAKMKWMRTFKAFDLNGYFVKKLIFASMLADSSDVCTKLQQLADDNKSAGMQFQLRIPASGKVIFETSITA